MKKRIAENIKIFSELRKKGRDLYYSPLTDTLYSDLNDLLTKHLGFTLLHELGVEEEGKKIWERKLPYKIKIGRIAKLLEGKSFAEYFEASKGVVEKVDVSNEAMEFLSRLKPSRLIFFTGTPRETAKLFVERKIDPVYNKCGKKQPIRTYATLLEIEDEILTGNVIFVPDKRFRSMFPYLQELYKKYL